MLTNLRMDPFERAEQERPWATAAGVDRAHVRDRARRRLRRPVAAELPRVPAAAEAHLII